MTIEPLKSAYEAAYQKSATDIFFSPGRVNLIGEHTDYNGGFVFPCALSFGTYLLMAPNNVHRINFRSLNIDAVYSLELTQLTTPLPNKAWANYPLGVIAQFIKRGVSITQGYDILFWGNVPAGAGLSSSAAMEVVTAFAFNELLGTGYDRTELAKIGQASEHEFAGVMCGIMDQFASAQGKKDHAIYLNCDTLEFDLVPVKLEGIKVVVSNTHSPHHLDSGAYNDRVRQCQLAVQQISAVRPIKNLAELSQADFNQVENAITDEVAHRRARHVVGEVQRTKDAVEALQQGNIELFGKLMTQSHISLRDDYEVTGLQLDSLAEAAWKVDGVLGSRMTGGGFGGCTVSLVRDEAIPTFIEQVGAEYTEKTGLKADFYIAEIGDGAHRVNA
ncbi:MAG: galactokinase [Paludibacteraceae bacterium]|nr:galactokinase [Paludibacteraceae bacterium]